MEGKNTDPKRTGPRTREQIEEICERYAECLDTGIFPGYPDEEVVLGDDYKYPELDDDEDLASEKWEDNHTILRDYEGDFDGVLIYHNEITAPLIKFICVKLEVDYETVKDLDFKLVG